MFTDLLLYLSFGEEKKNAFFSLFYSSFLFFPSPTLLFCRLDPPVCPSYQLASQTTALLDIWLDSPSVGLPVSFPIARI
jgi:hypothetical protein